MAGTIARDAAEIVGRDHELEVVEEILGRVRSGSPLLLLDGEAGIGKSTLWNAGIALARELELRTMVARPAEAEMQFGFAALADLFAEVPEEAFGRLPRPQARALEAALLTTEAKGRVDRNMQTVLGLLNVPSRADMIRLGSKLEAIQGSLVNLNLKVDRLLSTRPRTRKPAGRKPPPGTPGDDE